MSVFRMYLWREWREHRSAFLSLAVALPLGTWLLTLALPRGTVGDPLFHSVVALGFAIVMLVAIGGEMLGSERRGCGARWLERLPAGLAGAYRAKWVVFLAGLAGAILYGYLAAGCIAWMRHGLGFGPPREQALMPMGALITVWGLWTFSTSAWTLRGGLALLSAALVLAVVGYPAWRVIDAGYGPSNGELQALLALLVPGALIGSWLAFVHGARFGRGTLGSALLGLVPLLPALGATTVWASLRLAEREAFDPLASDFRLLSTRLSGDGRVVFGVGLHDRPRWDERKLPMFAMRLDLEKRTFEKLGHFRREHRRAPLDERSLVGIDELFFIVEEHTEPLVFDLSNGEPRAWDKKRLDLHEWKWRGLGQYLYEGGLASIRDPFRGKDYPLESLGEPGRRSSLLVRPGPWLLGGDKGWLWFDPDTGGLDPVAWPEHAWPLVLFPDGRILLKDPAHGLRIVHPEQGLEVTLDTQGVAVERIYRNPNGARFPSAPRDAADGADGPIVLNTGDRAWLILDEASTSVRRLPVPIDLQFLRLDGSDGAFVQDLRANRLARIDLVSGVLTTLWPSAQEE